MSADQRPSPSERPADFIVVRDGKVVQTISALNCVAAKQAVTEAGFLYAKTGPDDYEAEVDAFLKEALSR